MKSESSHVLEAGFATLPARPYLGGMTDRPKRPRDPNQLAKFIVDVATGDAVDQGPAVKAEDQRKGGVIGGKARAEALSPDQRIEIATKAAAKRWQR